MSNEREIEALAYDLGAKGSPAIEQDRLAFEAWMRGHAWALGAMWNGKEYTNDAEQGGYVCPYALRIRMIWAAWRDRGELARRLQPARVPEGDAVGKFPALPQTPFSGPNGIPLYDAIHMHVYALTCSDAWAAAPAAEGVKDEEEDIVIGEWSLMDRVEFALRDAGFDLDEAFAIAYRAATPAPESREADASTAFEGWSAAINAATELETNAPDERYRVRANAVRRWIEKRKPEAGQREGITDALMWLRGALDCPSFAWDADQREAAEVALASAQQAVKQERTGSRGEGGDAS